MSLGYASSRNVTNNDARNVPPARYTDITVGAPTAWVRPTDWLTLPTVSLGDNIITGLYAVYDNTQNYVSFIITGAYTVDWGDGSSPENFASSTSATHLFDYAAISDTTLCTRGYKQSVITITPQAGQTLSIVNLATRATTSPATRYQNKWLDLSISSPNLNSITISGVVAARMLEQVNLYSIGTGTGVLQGLFTGCNQLQSVNIYSDTSNITSTASMFSACNSLTTAPLFDTSAVISTANMFNSCFSLVSVPEYTTNNVTSMTNMFNNCFLLETAPYLNTEKVTDMSSMFLNCNSLVNVPTYNTIKATNMSSMFMSCYKLPAVPFFNTSNVTNMTSFLNSAYGVKNLPLLDTNKVTNMYLLCENARSIEYIPALDMSNVTTIQSAFNNCSSLVRNDIGKVSGAPKLVGSGVQALHTSCSALVYPPDMTNWSTGNCNLFTNMFFGCSSLIEAPYFNTSNVTTMNAWFSGCSSLTSVPLYNTSNVTNTVSMFNACSSLETVPLFDTSKVTSTALMFSTAKSLKTVPAFNTSNVTTMNSMFVGCSALSEIPLIDTSKTTTVALMFQNCSTLRAIPALNTSNCTLFNSMFSSATSLTEVPVFDTSKALNINSMFYSCDSLTEIPAFNFSNVNTATTNFVNSGGQPVSRIEATGLKLSLNIQNLSLGRTELQEVMFNLGSNTTAQTLTISGNPGTDSYTRLSCGTTAGSNVITFGSNISLSVGQFMYATGVNTGIPVTFDAAADTVRYTNGGGVNGLANGDSVMFTAITSTTGIVINTQYYVVNRTGTTFQVSSTVGGSALPLTTNGTGVMSIGGATISNQVLTVNAGNCIISGVAGITNASVTIVNRTLNTNYAVTKNWVISG